MSIASDKERYNFVIDKEVLKKLEMIKDRDGVPVGEQIRRGIVLWLKKKGVKVKE